MGYKALSLTLISAKGLNLTGKTEPYVAVSISGCLGSKKTIPFITRGGPWNHTVVFTVDDNSNSNRAVVFKVMQRRAFGWDKVVGEVRVALKDLLVAKKERQTTAICQVRTSSGKANGELEFSYAATDADLGFKTAGLVAGKKLSNNDNDNDDGYYDPRAADYDF